MRFEPKTEKEVDEFGLLADGEYQFEIADAVDTISKKGNDMIAVTLDIFDSDGMKHRVWDWLVVSSAGLCVRKLRHFAACVEVLDLYKAGELNAECLIGLTGKVKVGVRKSERYGSQNEVEDYIVPADYTPAAVEAKSEQAAAEDLQKEIDKAAKPTGKEIPF